MLNDSPDSTCTLSAAGSEVTIPVCEKRTVWYEFDTSATDAKLAIPYAVEIDGKVLPEFAHKAHVLSKTDRKITLTVRSGASVALYLNSDAHPNHRTHPVYRIRVGDRDALVKIIEKTGRLGHVRAEAGYRYDGQKSGRKIDSYLASLTGDIWMQVSHVYTIPEAEALLPADTDSVIRSAVISIYRGLPKPEMQLRFPASESLPPSRLRITFEEQDAVRMNTTICPLLTHILPRTHPSGFAALFAAARASSITELRIASCWRTSLGSIAHRAGLGLDVVYLESESDHILLNRTNLKLRSAPVTRTVSSEEREAYSQYEDAQAEASKRDSELMRAQSDLAKASEVADRQRCEHELIRAKSRKQAAEKNAQTKKQEWDRMREAHVPGPVQRFRENILRDRRVSQLFDPWYLDVNTRDKLPPLANEQKTALEALHRNHVHITIAEPKFL